MVEVHFTNERDNPISLVIKAEDVAPDVAGVNIQLSGPHSISEKIMTRMEAEKLHAALGQFLAASA